MRTRQQPRRQLCRPAPFHPGVQELEPRLLLSFGPATAYPVGHTADAVAVGDFNEDGIPDLVAVGMYPDGVSVLLGNGDGTFQPAQTFDGGPSPQAVAVGDLGNGHLDLVVANGTQAGSVSVLLGNGDGKKRGQDS